MTLTKNMDNSKAVLEWLDSARTESTRKNYVIRWSYWIEYCKLKGLPDSGDKQLEDMKQKRQSTDNEKKYFYDNEVVMFFKWLTTEFKGEVTNKPLSESSALAYSTAVRSFFAYHRYTLEIQKDKLPTSEKVTQTLTDHTFDIHQLRAMFQQGDLKERTILACGKDLWLRVGDFSRLPRELIELAIKREDETAQAEKRETDIVEFELVTEKEKEPASCHLSRETIELLREYLKTHPKTQHLFDLGEDALNNILQKLAEKSKITLTGRVRWHCLRKFGITLMHGKVTEPVMKYMCGKHISKDLKVYIQANRETFKAFKMLEPLLSLTKSNGNGVTSTLAKQLDELKKETFKRILFQKLLEKVIPKETMIKALLELAKEYDIDIQQVDVKGKTMFITEGVQEPVDTDLLIDKLAEKIEQKELKRILEENGNNH
jgi:hypothetical protein